MSANPEKTARPGRWKRRLLALALSLLLSLLGAELIVRIVRGSPLAERTPISRVRAHPTRGWEMIPDEDHFTYHHRVTINGHGFRGPEIPAEKGPGEVRVLALGDSMTYGQGVADDQTLPAHLQRLLRASEGGGRQWRVINSGHRAYSTGQEVALLEELGPELQPDIVVLFWFWNDLIEPDLEAKYDELVESGPIAFDAGAPLEGKVAREWRLKQLVRRSALAMYLYDAYNAMRAPETQVQYFESNFEVLSRKLDRMVELGRENGWQSIFAVIPDSNTLTRDHVCKQLAERAMEVADGKGMVVVDLLPVMRELSAEMGRKPVIPYDGHYLGVGNEVMAGELARVLLGG